MIDLYTAAAPNGRRATLIIEELELAYRIHNIDLKTGEHKQPGFLEKNPLGQVPVMIDHHGPGGKPITVSQSAAIALYLAEKTGKLLPQDPVRRVDALQQLFHVLSDVGAASTAIFITRREAPGSPALSVFVDRMINFLSVLDTRLSESEYIVEEISIVDLALYPLVALPHVKSLIETQTWSNLERWIASMSGRPSIVRAMAASPQH